ncbi:Sodium channel protein Nach [Eumeta japonica]|uniref:Sodium channel protein Nach n=1 Tax=Eumeta variegata TaxID=151549 RepID=A0A4C1VBR0_EUMVA|nr:Sodium channel protein Nach [Eumeta japonica]
MLLRSRKCVTEDERPLHYFRGYHNTDCDTECAVLAVRRACGCVPLFTPHHPGHPYCTLTALPCVVRIRNKMNERNVSKKECDCPRECFSRHYKIDSSVGNVGAHRHIVNAWLYRRRRRRPRPARARWARATSAMWALDLSQA